MKQVLEYRGYLIFKQSENEFSVKIDTPDGLLPVSKPFATCLEAIVAINRGINPPEKSPSELRNFLVDFFNISA